MKVTTEGRLQRILALVPWIAAHGEPTVASVCERFGITPSELTADLELLYLCGLHPYTPELLIEATIENGRVRIAYADYFSRPLRLTPQEGLALVASASALLAAPGSDPDGPLARGLTKLTAALGTEDALDVQLGTADPDMVRVLREAIDGETQVRIDYWSYARGVRGERVIEPDATFSVGGQQYVSAWCTQAEAERIFRLDRVLDAVPLPTKRSHPRSDIAPALFSRFDEAEGGMVTLLLSEGARWVTEQYPIAASREQADGRLEVTLMVTEWAWLDRLVLRLGPQATVVAAPQGWEGTASAASQILARYRQRS
jgi:proteasome accessory factor C